MNRAVTSEEEPKVSRRFALSHLYVLPLLTAAIVLPIRLGAQLPNPNFNELPNLPVLVVATFKPSQDYELVGLPGWARSTHYDVQAKADPESSGGFNNFKLYQLNLMLRPLLADRVKLKVHWETRELPVYALVVGKRGTKLHTSNQDDEQRKTEVDDVVLMGGGIAIQASGHVVARWIMWKDHLPTNHGSWPH